MGFGKSLPSIRPCFKAGRRPWRKSLKRKTGMAGEEVDSSAEPKTLRSTSMCPIRKPLHACLPKNIIQMGKHLRIECDTIKTGLHLF